jgi:hypothetical protein
LLYEFDLQASVKTEQVFMIPSSKQWARWSLPSKLTAVGTLIGAVSLALYLVDKGVNFSSRSDSAPDVADNHLFVECRMTLMPVATTEAPAHVLMTQDLPHENGGGGLADMWGDLRNASADKGPAWAYRCEINNYTGRTLFNVSMSPRLTFRESLSVPGQEKSRQQGMITLEREWTFTIPKFEPPPGPPFVFYVWNCCVRNFVQVRLPDHALAADGKQISVTQSAANLFEALIPISFD